jgi:hydroxypyruvate reductase 1
VYEDEPAMKPGLSELPNAVIVPHIASASMWTRSGMVSSARQPGCVLAAGRVRLPPVCDARMPAASLTRARVAPKRTQATLAAANVAAVLQGFPASKQPDINAYLEAPIASLPQAAPSIVNAADINMALV